MNMFLKTNQSTKYLYCNTKNHQRLNNQLCFSRKAYCFTHILSIKGAYESLCTGLEGAMQLEDRHPSAALRRARLSEQYRAIHVKADRMLCT